MKINRHKEEPAYAGSKFLHFVCQNVDECRTPDTNIRLSDQDSM